MKHALLAVACAGGMVMAVAQPLPEVSVGRIERMPPLV